MIQVKHLNFKYASGNEVLEDINLEIKEGEVVSIIGKNGAGKSSLLRQMAGLAKPTSGEILVDGMNVQDKKYGKEIRKKLGIVFQNPDNQILFPKVYDDVEFALKNLALPERETRIREALQKVGMEEYINDDTYELSLGQKQRVNFASVLAVNPQYILLDEPTTMIDSTGKDNIYQVIRNLKKEGYSIVFVTNYMNEIILSDRVLVLEDRKIKTIFKKEELFEKIEVLKESNIKIPEIIDILVQLRERNIAFSLKEWTIEEMEREIVKACVR